MSRRLPPDEIERILAARPDVAGCDALAQRLAPWVTEARRAKMEAVLEQRLASLAIAVENPYDPHNAAAVVRSAEAFGVATVHVINASRRVLRSKRLTTGTHHWVDLRTYRGGKKVEGGEFDEVGPALDAFFEVAGRAGMRVAGACVDGACALEELPVDAPLCLLMGNEHAGLSEAAKARCDLRFRIPMQGFAESLNLSVSSALSLYVTAGRRRAQLGRAGDLDDEQIARTRARWYLNSVDARTIRGLFAEGEG